MGLFSLVRRVVGSRNTRLISRLQRTVHRINQLEQGLTAITDEQLKAKTAEFKQRLAQGESLDDLLPEAFAVVREASVRVFGLRPFDTQLIGGIVLHQGRIAEMRTGDRKSVV